jgi:hypothetical protein
VNYSKIAATIAAGLIAVCLVGIVVCLIALWVLPEVPLVISIGVTAMMAALASMFLFAWLGERQ